MSVILQKLSEWIFVPLITFFVEKVVNVIRDYLFVKQTTELSEQSNKESVDKTNAATTPEQKKDAAEDVIKKF